MANDEIPFTNPPPTPKAPWPKLLDRLSDDQRTGFLSCLGPAPPSLTTRHLRSTYVRRFWLVAVSHHSPGRRPVRVPRCFLHAEKNGCGACSLMPLKISISPDSAPLCSRPLTGFITLSPSNPTLYSTNIWPPGPPEQCHPCTIRVVPYYFKSSSHEELEQVTRIHAFQELFSRNPTKISESYYCSPVKQSYW